MRRKIGSHGSEISVKRHQNIRAIFFIGVLYFTESDLHRDPEQDIHRTSFQDDENQPFPI